MTAAWRRTIARIVMTVDVACVTAAALILTIDPRASGSAPSCAQTRWRSSASSACGST
jgi:hypothetical protein